jgi:molecular chaperone GrpE
MSEDEGADDAPGDPGAGAGDSSGEEQVASDADVEAGAADDVADDAAGESGADADGETDAAGEADDPFETADPVEASDDDSDGVDAGTPVSEDIVDRVAEHDEDAASEVRALVERAFQLKGRAERVPELEGRVEELEAEVDALAGEREELEAEVGELEADREDLKSKLARKQADFKNYKERQKRKQEQLKERATEDLVERLVDVRDNLKRALDQDVDDDESIRGGVEMTLKEFDRVLGEENVEEIAPDAGDEVDPQRHEVMVRVDSELPEGTVAEVFNPGYEMADRVIQAAQVTVSNGAEHDPDDDGGGDGEGEDAQQAETDEGNDGKAVALGGEVDDGEAKDGGDGEATDGDISAALDDE